MNYTLVLVLIAIVYLLAITYMHYYIMTACRRQDNIPDTKRVLGTITDTRPNNVINKDLK